MRPLPQLLRASRQWEDSYEGPNTGDVVTEREVLEQQGRIAWALNQIDVKVRSLLGQTGADSVL